MQTDRNGRQSPQSVPTESATGAEKKRKKKKKAGEEAGSTLHVRGVAAGPDADARLVQLFSAFGTVVQVTVRERWDQTSGADTSWALVTMASKHAAEQAVADGIDERLDPARPITMAVFSQKQAGQSTGGMVQARKQAAAKVIQSKWRQKAAWQETMMMSFEFGSSDGEDVDGGADGVVGEVNATANANANAAQDHLDRQAQAAAADEAAQQMSAAVTIQSRQRGKKERRQRHEEVRGAHQYVGKSQSCMNDEVRAAVRIQARQRGKQGQRQARVRRRIENHRAERSKQTAAATRIQATHRGKKGRARSKTKQKQGELLAQKQRELAVRWEQQQKKKLALLAEQKLRVRGHIIGHARNNM